MKRPKIALAIVAAVAILIWIASVQNRKHEKLKSAVGSPPHPSAVASTKASSVKATPLATTFLNHGVNTMAPAKVSLPSDAQAKASLQQMSDILGETFKNSRNLDALMSHLKRSGQNPFTARQGTGDSGYMFFVKTKTPPPGTRHFHAQFMEGEGTPFVQHISFEFKPGPTSLSDAVQAAKKSFAVGAPLEQTNDFIKWKLDDTYILWIKKKAAKDLRDNPFRAYDLAKDIGTVQMTVEMEIHDKDDGHEHQ